MLLGEEPGDNKRLFSTFSCAQLHLPEPHSKPLMEVLETLVFQQNKPLAAVAFRVANGAFQDC
jgi:hypothetical protein